ncbi:putative ferric-chelate reductase 1 homolog [Artemia franciscana]|uniref:putative ferric-chelate reductase 1 homolog n=1 Tax=Artemia franciscana TaxID=6661 RepID=UPI0032D9D441
MAGRASFIFMCVISAGFYSNNASKDIFHTERSRRTRQLLSSEFPIYDDCGVTKQCFGYPPGCFDNYSCSMAVSYRKFNQSYEFELLADISENATITNRTGIYVAVGLSPTGKMDKSSVTDCSAIGGTIKASMSYNQGRNNQRLPKPTDGVNLTRSVLSNNTIYCSFIRNATFSAFSDEFDLENDSYYLILAKGPAEKERIKYHTKNLLRHLL